MRLAHLALLVAAVTTVAAGCGDARTTAGLASPAPSPTAATELSDQDRTWMKKIHQGNMAETQAGQLAEGKGTAAEVKELGRLLVTDHTALDDKVAEAAMRLGVKLPTTTSDDQKAAAQALESASQADFDQEFLTAMRKEHAQAVADTKKEINKGSSAEVKAMAEEALPRLQHHLDAIKEAMKEN
jgi:putative membrane protein